jgi:hypothetical protein
MAVCVGVARETLKAHYLGKQIVVACCWAIGEMATLNRALGIGETLLGRK